MIEIAYAQSRAQDATSGAAADTMTQLGDFFINVLLAIPRFIGAVIVFVLSIWFAKILTRMVLGRVTRQLGDMNQELVILLERTVYAIVVIFGAIISLQILGFSDISNIIGFFGLGLGFAFKDLLANFIAGVVILTQKKFKIGDMVRVEENIGHITEIESRTTQIRSLDGTNLIIPNSEMLTSVVQNYTANSFRRIDIAVGVHYNDDLALAVKTAQDATNKHPDVVREPAVAVLVTDFADSSINLQVRFWVESTMFWPMIKSQVIQNIKKAFDQEGITIPFPIRTLSLDGYDGPLHQALNLTPPADAPRMPTTKGTGPKVASAPKK